MIATKAKAHEVGIGWGSSRQRQVIELAWLSQVLFNGYRQICVPSKRTPLIEIEYLSKW